MKKNKVILTLLVLLLISSSAFAAPGGKAGGAINPPGQSTYGPDGWSLRDCIMWSKEAGFWHVEDKPNEFIHWWLFDYTE